ncbi:unnamed protein product [Ixodes hexagonus]
MESENPVPGSSFQSQLADLSSAGDNKPGNCDKRRTTIGAADDEALLEYAAYIDQLCPGMSTAGPEPIYTQLRVGKSSATSSVIGRYLLCTDDGTKPCHLVQDLSIWNEFLRVLDAELKEVSPGKLNVLGLHGIHPWAEFKESDLRHSSMLLHWLLKEHRCIKALEFKQAVFVPGESQLLCDALRTNSRLTRFKLSDYGYREDTSMQVITAISTMTQLVELELTHLHVSSSALAHLMKALQGTMTLKSLAFYFIILTPDDTQHFLEGLSKNTTIKALRIDACCFVPGDGKVFKEYLAKNEVLEDLTVEHENEKYNYHTKFNLGPLSGALEQNKALKKLCLMSFDRDPSRCELFFEALANNSTLQHLEIDSVPCSYWGFKVEEMFAELIGKNTGLLRLDVLLSSGCSVASLAAAIRQSVTLQKLALHLSDLTQENARLFLEALASNKSLELVRIGNVWGTVIPEFYRILQETGTEARVKFCATIDEPTRLASTLKNCPMLSEVSYDLSDCSKRSLKKEEGFLQFISCHHLVELSISLDQYKITSKSAWFLASFLSSTKKLKVIKLSIFAPVLITHILLEGLSRNRSISEMSLEFFSYSQNHLRLFKTMLEGNLVLRDLSLTSSKDKKSLSVLRELPQCLICNYSLLKVTMDKCLRFETCMFQVQDIMRRNLSFLNRAAEFVMGLHSKCSADAFEHLCQSEALVKKVQELDSGTESDARHKIKESIFYLNSNFLIVVGVVKDNLTCDRDGGHSAQVQFDQLGLDIWLKIRSFLRVSDIRDCEVAESFPVLT